MATRSKPSDGGVQSSTADSTQVTWTPQRSANRLALARPTGEKSTPVTSHPCSASQIELRPSPQARSTARPAGRSDGLGHQELVGRARPHQLVAAVALVPLPAVHGHLLRSDRRAHMPAPPGASAGTRRLRTRARAHRPNQRRPFVAVRGWPWHRSAGSTCPSTCSTCMPHPFQDGRPHCLHVTAAHICRSSRRSERRRAHWCSLRMIFAIFRLMARNRVELGDQARAGPKGLGRRERCTGDVVGGVVHRPLLSYSGIRCQPGRALAL